MNITDINKPQAAGFDWPTELRALIARYEAFQKGVQCPNGVQAAAAPEPAQEPAKPKAATKETRKWMLEKLAVYGDDVAKYARAKQIILPQIETEKDWPLHKVPTSKDAMQALIKDIEEWRKDQIPMSWPTPNAPLANATADQAPWEGENRMPAPAPAIEAPPDTPAPDYLKAEGVVTNMTQKSGEKNNRPWTKFSIQIGEHWYNTFSKSLVEQADKFQGQNVEVEYTDEGQFGRTLRSITGTGEVVP